MGSASLVLFDPDSHHLFWRNPSPEPEKIMASVSRRFPSGGRWGTASGVEVAVDLLSILVKEVEGELSPSQEV